MIDYWDILGVVYLMHSWVDWATIKVVHGMLQSHRLRYVRSKYENRLFVLLSKFS